MIKKILESRWSIVFLILAITVVGFALRLYKLDNPIAIGIHGGK